MRESRSHGSVRGALSNGRPYRESSTYPRNVYGRRGRDKPPKKGSGISSRRQSIGPSEAEIRLIRIALAPLG